MLAIPALFVILRIAAGAVVSVAEAAWVFAGTLVACAAGLAVTHAVPMRMVRRIEEAYGFFEQFMRPPTGKGDVWPAGAARRAFE